MIVKTHLILDLEQANFCISFFVHQVKLLFFFFFLSWACITYVFKKYVISFITCVGVGILRVTEN